VDAETDDRLMVAVQAGDLSRLGDLFERHHRALFQFFLRLTGDSQASEDLVQDVFLRMLRYRATYQPGSQMRTWMYRLARNAHIDRYHSRSPEASLEDQALLEPASAAPGAADLLQHEEQTDLVAACGSHALHCDWLCGGPGLARRRLEGRAVGAAP
jgi:RNA polymerase sigma factor (sigma-70 family)